MSNLLDPETVFAAFWATALQDAQYTENDFACEEGREPHQFQGEPNSDYAEKYKAACAAICAAAEPVLATLDLNTYPKRQGEDSLSEVFGGDLYLTAAGHGAGFWDGDWSDEAGDKLTEIAKVMPCGDLAGHIDGGYFFL